MSVQQRTLTGNALAPRAVQGLLSLKGFCIGVSCCTRPRRLAHDLVLGEGFLRSYHLPATLIGLCANTPARPAQHPCTEGQSTRVLASVQSEAECRITLPCAKTQWPKRPCPLDPPCLHRPINPLSSGEKNAPHPLDRTVCALRASAQRPPCRPLRASPHGQADNREYVGAHGPTAGALGVASRVG